jgi:type I restriction enzyme S subunit
VAYPPISEQEVILLAISNQTQPITATIARIERKIELLREYRTRLIADVVTGKLDVRDAAARLPQVEDAPADEIELAEIEGSGEELAEEDA